MTGAEQHLFPLVISAASGLGLDWALERAGRAYERAGRAYARPPRLSVGWIRHAAIDFTAVSHLDEMRTLDLTRSRENLLPTDLEARHSMGVQ